MTDTSCKMFEIASHLSELNNDGKVKAFRGSEKGYAKVIEICRGCSIFVHHEKNDDLIIDLLVSHHAKEKKPPLCGNTIKKFKEFFGDLCKISMSNWSHPINTQKDHERYYVDVNGKNTSEIIFIIERLKKEFA